jgi:hypothetical protein
VCLDNNLAYLQKIEDHKIQTDLILDQVNPTKLKEWIDILSSFHTRNTKSSYIENDAYWLKSELQNLCDGRVFFYNYTLIEY